MIKIYKIDEKTVKVVRSAGGSETEYNLPALFVAFSINGKILIKTEAKWLSNITVDPVDVSDIYIEDVQQTDVNACISALNKILFNKGSGGVSPDYNLLENKPSINGIELIGDVEMDIYAAGQNVEFDKVNETTWINVDQVDISKSVINQNDGNSIEIWAGTQDEYDALSQKDLPNVIYMIYGEEDDSI
jgi:hypothetical protein